MGWVKEALQQLQNHKQCQVRPLGGSMRGRIESGQLVTIEKISPKDVQLDDAVFIKWKNGYLLHLVKEIQGEEVLIGNNVGKINGWIPRSCIIGKVIHIED